MLKDLYPYSIKKSKNSLIRKQFKENMAKDLNRYFPKEDKWMTNKHLRDFSDGPVVKNPPSNSGEMGSITGRRTKIPHAMGQLSPCTLEPAYHN